MDPQWNRQYNRQSNRQYNRQSNRQFNRQHNRHYNRQYNRQFNGQSKICLTNDIFIKIKINFKRVRGTPRTLLDLPRHFLDHPNKIKMLTEVVPKDLLRPPRHIPDDPKNLKNRSNELSMFWKVLGPSRGPDHWAVEGDPTPLC